MIVKNKNKPKTNSSSSGDKISKKGKKREAFIVKKLEFPEYICPYCGELIKEISSAISSKNSKEPAHFNCIMSLLKKNETLKEKEELIYIGSGNFAVVYFENPSIRKKFKIIKIIEWEEKNTAITWKAGIAAAASQV